MDYNLLERSLSSPRLNRYLKTCKYSKKSATKLYVLNLKVSQSFYPLLNLFEITLRNAIHEELKNHFNAHDWVIREKNGFMSNRSLGFTNFHLKKSVLKAEQGLRDNYKTITPSRVISELMFGFWTNLFEKHHYRLINGSIINVFKNRPPHINRADISKGLNLIREFRNRIYHNEPICFRLNTINLENAILVKNKIIMLIEWIDPNLVKLFKMFNELDSHILNCESLKRRIN